MRYIFSFIFSVDAVLFELMNRCMLLLTDKRIQSTSSFIGKKKAMHASKSFSKLFYMLKLISPSSPSKVNFYLQRQVSRGQKYLQKKTFGVMYLIQTALVLLRLDLNPERRSCNVKFCNGSLEDVLLLECWSTLIKGPFTEIVFRLRGSLRLGGAIFSYPL